MDPYPDQHARFIILDVNANGFLIPIYGRHLSNEVVATLTPEAIGPRCIGLRPLVAAYPDLLFIDDQDRAVDCGRACAISLPDGSCGAYRLFDPHPTPGVAPWGSLATDGSGVGWLTSGWSFPEAWGTWSVGADSVLSIPAPALHAPLVLDVDWFAAVNGMTAELTAAGKTHPVVFEYAGQGGRRSFTVPPVDTSPVVVHIHVDHPVAAADGRLLSIGVDRVRLRVQGD
jgi:hypothetical protein